MTMATTIDQQVALDEYLIPSSQRLRIGRRNFRLPSDIQSKEATLQVVYDVLLNSPLFRAFQVTADIDTKKSVLDLEAFREMLHISPRIPNLSFAELPTKEEILDFLSFRLSQAQMLWGFYHRINIGFAYLIWEDFVYQVEHKNQKRSNEMNYPRFTKVIIDYFVTRKPSISRRNRITWHYVRDDALFSTIKVVSRHQTTQQYGAILPIELTTDEIRNSKAYKEYYACATGEASPKPKASARKKKDDTASSTTPPTPTPTTKVVSATRLSATAKGKQHVRAKTPTEPTDVERTEAEQLKIVLKRSRQETHISQQHGSGTDEGTGSRPGVSDVPSDDSEEELSWNSFDDEDIGVGAGKDDDEDDDDNDEEEELAKNDDEETESGKGGDEVSQSEGKSDDEETRQEEKGSFDPIPRTSEGSKEESNNEEDQELRLSEEAMIQEEEEADELYFDVNINQGRGLQVTQNVKNSHVTLTPVQPDGVESIFTTASSPIVSLQSQTSIMTPSTIATITTSSDAPIPSTTIPSIILKNLPTFNSAFRFDERLRTSYAIEVDLSEMELKKILIEKMEGNKSIQRSDEQRNLYKALVEAYDADKAILDTYGDSTILKRRREDDDQEGPSAGSNRGSKRQKEGGEHASASTPSETATEGAGRSTIGSQSRQLSASESTFAEEPVQTTCQMEEPPHPVFKTDRAWNKTLPAAQGDAQSWISDLARQTDACSSFNELLDTPIDFFNFIMNRLNVDTLTPELLAGLTYELMRGSCISLTELEYHLEEVYKATTNQLDWVNPKGQQYPHNLLQPLPLIPDNRGRRVIPFDHFINNDLEYLRGGALSHKYTTSVTKTKATDYGHIKWIEDLVPRTMWIQQPMDYNMHALWGVSYWGRKQWHDYKHLDWISVRHDDDQIYKFKEGDFKRLRLQDIKDMLLLLIQGKLSNLTVEERFAFNVSLRMFTRSIVIQRRVEDLQLGVESYQKRLNLTKPDTYRPDLKGREAYTAHSNPRGFLYQNKDKKNRLMRIDELHKFSDGTLNDVRNALNDRLKGIRIQYLSTTIWRRGDKDRAAVMIQAIEKMLKTRRIMRSLEKFVGGRLYEGDFRMLQRTI
nr:hypothetical protein [Tanacetum cinerariifolium]